MRRKCKFIKLIIHCSSKTTYSSFHLRLVLIYLCGPTSYGYLKTITDKLHATNYVACLELQFLENDNLWDTTLGDAALSSSPHTIHQLFTTLFKKCFSTNSTELWEKYERFNE